MLRICEHPDCTTLTLGALCNVHEAPATGEIFPRGRPYPGRTKPQTFARTPLQIEAARVESAVARAVSFGGGIQG
jgi:hypothetical protein